MRKSVKLYVEFEGLKLVYIAKKDLVIGKLLKKLESNFEESFCMDSVPSFKRLTENGYLVSLYDTVGEVFEDNSELQVHHESPKQALSTFSTSSAEKLQKGLKKESSKDWEFRKDKEKDTKNEIFADKPSEKNKTTENKTGKKEEAKKEEVKSSELKREPSKQEPKTESSKKNKRPDVKEPIIKIMKIEEEKKSFQNDQAKKDLMKTSSESESDSNIFTKDEKKPNLSKANLFRA